MKYQNSPGSDVRLLRTVYLALTVGMCASGDYPPYLWDAASAAETRKQARARQARAVAICEKCPVRDLCGLFADMLPETSGVWGGEVYEDASKRPYESRRVLHERMSVARPELKRLVRQAVGTKGPAAFAVGQEQRVHAE